MRTKSQAERRTVSDKRAAGRKGYKPHHAGSAKNWRSLRDFGVHRLTVESQSGR